jgi:branched-chain amino acid transport system substrate-binding protein
MYGRATAGILALLATLFLAACGGQAEENTASSDSGGEDTSPLVIGMTIEKTGPVSVLAPAADGAQAAVDYLNENGGVDGREVRLIVKDNASDSSRAIQNVNQLAEEGASIIVGPAFIQNCYAIEATVAKLKIPNVCASPSDLSQLAPPYQYGIGPATSQEDEAVYKFFADQGITKVGTLAAKDQSGDQARDWAKDAEAANGITVDVQLTDPAATTYKPQLQKMLSGGVEALYYTSCGGVSITAVGEALDLGFEGPIMLINCFAGEGVAESVKSFANGQLLTPVPEFMLEPPYTEERAEANELYNEVVGAKEITTADGWDAVLLAAEAVKKAGSVDAEALNAALEEDFTFFGTWAGGTFTAEDHRGQSIEGVLVPAEYTKDGGFKRVE